MSMFKDGNVSKKDIQFLLKDLEAQKAFRSTFDTHYQEVAERVLPRMANFNVSLTPGEKRNQQVFDSTAALSLERFAAIVESFITPRSQRWHRLTTSNPELNKIRNVQLWFDEVTRIMFGFRYSPHANYASQQHESYMSLGAFGTGLMFIGTQEESDQFGLLYKSVPLSHTYMKEGPDGRVTTVYREMMMPLQDIIFKFGAENVPEDVKKHLEKEPDKQFMVIHCVMPNRNRQTGKKIPNQKKFRSVYILEEKQHLLKDSGFDNFPFAVNRYVTTANEVYGRSPAMMVLPDIKMVNEMAKTNIQAGQRVVNPPILTMEDGAINGFNMTPGAINYGGINDQGQETIKPFNTGANLPMANEMMNDSRNTIKDAFFVNLFQILVENPQMTATEVIERTREKGALMSPTMGRQQSDGLGPMIERELSLLSEANLLPPIPPELIEAGGEYRIEYDSPLTRAQDAEEVSGIMRTLEIISPIAQFDPSILRYLDGEKILKISARVNGMPTEALRSDEEVAAIDKAAQEQAEQQQMLDAAQPMSEAMKNVAETNKINEDR